MISENSFLLREKKVWIYAAGSIGAVLLKLLESGNIDVEGFIDRRAHAILHYHGLTVKSLQEAAQCSSPEDYAVIITVRNVFEHSSIAEQIYAAGFRNIIFKPLDRIWGKKMAPSLQEIDRAHDTLLVDIKIPDFPIPTLQDSNVSMRMDQISIRHAGQEELCVSIPVETLIINRYRNNIWSNVPALGYFPAIELYQGFNGTAFMPLQECLDQYIETMASYGADLVEIEQTESWRKNTLEARHSVYVEMDLLFQVDPKFFERNCSMVKWNKRRCFELTSSGKNRISFLIAKGMSYIPVKMSVDDYEQWRNQDAARRFSRTHNETGQLLFCKIPHPDYYHVPVQTPGYTQKWLLPICMILTKSIYAAAKDLNFADYCIYDQNFDQGALSRVLGMFGFQWIRGQVDDLTRQLDELLQFEGNRSSQVRSYYAAVLDFKATKGELQRILEKTERFLFCWMESSSTDWYPWIEQMGFIYLAPICECISGGRLVKGALFARPEKTKVQQEVPSVIRV